MDKDESISVLIDKLDIIDLEVRLAAQRRLIERGHEAFEPLVAAMRSEEGAKCWVAAKIIVEIDPSRAVPPLLEALTNSPHLILRQTAAQLLGKLGSPQVVPALINALDDCTVMVQLAAAEALGNLGDVRAVPSLIMVLQKSDSSTIQHTVIRALGNLGDPRAIEAILPFVNSENYHVHSRAVDSLHKLNHPDY
ncbi:MAG TPA: HEAT repeat domain-containing protein [Aggregatilineaceae bacterium]|nr:HEAT repeat domain-containing protein [Aggregatilineaceae bacterium]